MIAKTLATLAVSLMVAHAAMAAPIPDVEPMQYAGEYRVTAYAYYEGDGENYYTAGGYTPTPYYTVATNEEFDIGTILYVEGIGEVQVQDRGSFPEGVIDLHIGYDPMESFEDTTRSVYVVRY